MRERLDDLATDFLLRFSRFEYALKAMGILKEHKGVPVAEANWDSFAAQFSDRLSKYDAPNFQEARRIILENPPKKQVIQDGAIKWATSAFEGRMADEELLLYVRRVRNNLFHGGKFNGNWLDPARSYDLLQQSLVVLEACLSVSKELKEAYENKN
jgi:hypothetical protein